MLKWRRTENATGSFMFCSIIHSTAQICLQRQTSRGRQSRLDKKWIDVQIEQRLTIDSVMNFFLIIFLVTYNVMYFIFYLLFLIDCVLPFQESKEEAFVECNFTFSIIECWIPRSEHCWKENSDTYIEINQQTFDQNSNTLPTELFQLMRVTVLTYIHTLLVFSSSRGCIIWFLISTTTTTKKKPIRIRNIY